MYSVVETEAFSEWLAGIKDITTRIRLAQAQQSKARNLGGRGVAVNKIKTRPFDMSNYLTSEADIQEYLSQVLEEGESTDWQPPWATLPVRAA